MSKFTRDTSYKGSWEGKRKECCRCHTEDNNRHEEICTESPNDSDWYSSKEGALFCHACAVGADVRLGGPVMPVHRIKIINGGDRNDNDDK